MYFSSENRNKIIAGAGIGFGLLLLVSATLLIVYRPDGRVSGIKTENYQPVRGLIIPHHDLAREMIISSLDKVQGEYDLIFIFSPNHFQSDRPAVITSDKSGDVPIDPMITDEIAKKFQEVEVDNPVIGQEHGIGIPAGYLKYYFPKAKFVPLIFSRKTGPELVNRLAETLVEVTAGKSVLFVASVDFSHDQTSLSGMSKNRETTETIKNFDYDRLFGYGDDHLDSPAAVALLMKITEETGGRGFEIWQNSHGAEITGNPTLNGTGYVTGVFY